VSLDVSQPYWPHRPLTGIALPVPDGWKYRRCEKGGIRGEKKEIKISAYCSNDNDTRKDIKLQAEETLSIERHKLKINECREESKKWGRLKDIREMLEEPRNIE
jgi:hypothetical protein